MDQMNEQKKRGRPAKAKDVPKAVEVADQAAPVVEPINEPIEVTEDGAIVDAVADAAPIVLSVPIPAHFDEVPLNEQCPADIVLAVRSLVGVVCSFKAGRLVCIDGREFRAAVVDGRVEVYEQ